MGYRILIRCQTESFYKPDMERIFCINPEKELAKLIFEGDEGMERLWVKITKKIDHETWEGTLESVPTVIKSLQVGDPVSFPPIAIIDIWRPDYK